MPIPTSRTCENAKIVISDEKCNGCSLCVQVCKDFSLIIEDKKLKISSSPIFGCIGCGQCMAICPNDAIEIYGREISPNYLFNLPPKDSITSYEKLIGLFDIRRSIRDFQNKEIEDAIIDKIIEASSKAPMGIPPSDVNLIVLKGKEKTKQFAYDFCKFLEEMKWMTSKLFLFIVKLFFGKSNYELFNDFVKPLIITLTKNMKDGINLLTYDAPLAIYFYGSPFSDPADPIIAATYAMITAESLGLGTCMIGTVHPMIQKGKKAKIFRKKYKIKYTSKEGLVVLFGYPKYKYKKGIKRTFASIEYI